MPKRFNGCEVEYLTEDDRTLHIIAWWAEGWMAPSSPRSDVESSVSAVFDPALEPAAPVTIPYIAERVALALNCSQVSVRDKATGLMGIYIA